jgi:hypothetical protein
MNHGQQRVILTAHGYDLAAALTGVWDHLLPLHLATAGLP